MAYSTRHRNSRSL